MKKIFRFLILICLFFLNLASTCCDEDEVIVPTVVTLDPTPVINTVNNGTWRITFYEDSGTNETTNFTGYNFTFGSGGVLTVTNGTNTYTGSWSVTSDTSGDDSPSNDLDFNIAFSAPATFVDLTED